MKLSEQKQLAQALDKSINKHARALRDSKCSLFQRMVMGLACPSSDPCSTEPYLTTSQPHSQPGSLKAKLSSEGPSSFPLQSLSLAVNTRIKIFGANQGSTTNENKTGPLQKA